MMINLRPVLTKRDFVQRYNKGEFGNHSMTWNSLRELDEQQVLSHCKPDTLFHVRNRVTGAETWYNVKPEDLPKIWFHAVSIYGADSLYISEMAPTHKTTFQGELSYQEGQMSVFGSRVKLPMRDALKKDAFTLVGLKAQAAMKVFCDQVSYDWIQILIDRYPDHVIEFSCYSQRTGTENLNTMIWEVRKGY